MATKKKKNINVPNLRFPGFDGEWIEKKLGDIAEKINSGKTPLGGEAVYTDEGVLFIRSQNVNNDKLDLSSSVYIPEAVNEGMKNSVVLPNDILLNITGASLGRSCVVPGGFTVGNVNQHVCIIRLGKEYNPRFIQPILSSVKGQNILTSLQTGSGREGLNFESIRRIKVYTPNQVEQDKIASFLAIIQDRIDTQNKIIEKLETLIKGIRECLLNKQLRFFGFSDDWKKYKVSDFLEFFPTNSLSWEQLDYYNGGTLYNLHYGLIHQGAPTLIDTDSYTLPAIKLSSNPINFTLCENGDIVFADASEDTIDVAKAVEIINCGDKKIVCGLHTIHGRDKLSLTVKGFKGHLFRSMIFRHQVRQLAQGTKVFSVSIRTFNECYVDIPSMKEQLKISALLAKIDQRIDCEKKLLARYRQQKSYLLGSLFI